MNIGFDAKRAFLNRSGLGNYSRFVIQSLIKFHGEHNYFLFTPAMGNKFSEISKQNAQIVMPGSAFNQLLPSLWRSFGIAGDIRENKINIFHGLSGEIPMKLKAGDTKTVVTIHDLIFLRYPEFYKPIDRRIYQTKFKSACKNTDKIIAFSQQTKSDIVEFFDTPEDKIEVIYQGCDERFHKAVPFDIQNVLKEKYILPDKYILYVGTIEERKNLLSVLKALQIGKIEMPLVVVGKQTPYMRVIKDFIHKNRLENITFLTGVPDEDLPGIFQMASIFIYPSVFEGFGIPILEALYSKVPVITSVGSCFSEAGGSKTIYTDPQNTEEIAYSVNLLKSDNNLATLMTEEGYKHALTFDQKSIADQIMNLYNRLVNE